MKLIDKDAVLAEIDKRIEVLQKHPMENHKTICHLDSVKQSVNSLEVKEVDLEEEIEKSLKRHSMLAVGKKDFTNIAKHFFELGLRASNPLTWEDILIIHRCIKDAMNYHLYAFQSADGQQKVYEEILKRFKAQKGEKV